MTKLNINDILGKIGDKYNNVDHVDGIQHDPNTMSSTNFKQEYTVVIRKKKYYAISALEGENAYINIYQINNFSSISTSISTTGSIGSCNISVVGNSKIVCADRQDQDTAGWDSFNSLLREWSYNINDMNETMDSKGNYIYSDVLYDNIDDMKKMKYGWKIAEKCDFEPMDEIYIYAKSRKEKEAKRYKVYQIFFGYISDVTKSYTAGKSNPIISIKAHDHLKLLQNSYITNTFAGDYRYAQAAAHYDTDFAGNIIIDDNPYVTNKGPELKYNPYTNVFAGAYPYEIVTKCARDAGIPDSFLKKRIEKIKRIPFMPQINQNTIEPFESNTSSRLGFLAKASEALFIEIFADEEGNIVEKIPNYTLGINKEPANNAYLDLYLSDSDKINIKNVGEHEVTKTEEVTTYETVTETLSESIQHTVVKGDTLWDLAYKYLGSNTRWVEIYDINTGIIRDPHWIYPGQVINIKRGRTNSKQVEVKKTITTTEKVNGGTLSSVTDKYIPVIYDNEIISFVLTDSDSQVVNCFEIHQEVPLVQASLDGIPAAVKRVVQDWGSIIRFGMRPARTVSTPLLDRVVGPVLFGTLMVQQSLSQRYTGTLTMIEESSIRVGNPIRLLLYDEHPYKFQSDQLKNGPAQAIFYVERIERTIKPDGISTMTLTLTAGRVMGMESIYDKMSLLYGGYFDEYEPVEFNLGSYGNQNINGGSSGGGVAETDNASRAWNYLIAKGLTKEATAGILGNLEQESNINPERGGGGIAQWIGERWQALLNYASSNGLKYNSMEAQLGFMWHEISSGKQFVTVSGLNSRGVEDAAVYFCEKYERAGTPMMENRKKYAREFYNRFKDAGTAIINSGNITTRQSEIITFALTFLGVPYVWGGKTPSGFDCSGFVSYVYAHFGVSIPSYIGDPSNTYSMSNAKYGIDVSVNSLRPADLIFMRNYEHVGMYIGNNQYVHAPRTGDVIKISNLNASSVCGAKRLI